VSTTLGQFVKCSENSRLQADERLIYMSKSEATDTKKKGAEYAECYTLIV